MHLHLLCLPRLSPSSEVNYFGARHTLTLVDAFAVLLCLLLLLLLLLLSLLLLLLLLLFYSAAAQG